MGMITPTKRASLSAQLQRHFIVGHGRQCLEQVASVEADGQLLSGKVDLELLAALADVGVLADSLELARLEISL
jgi:hypothetical protein